MKWAYAPGAPGGGGGGAPLSQHSCFQNQLLPEREVGNLQVLQQLVNDVPGIAAVAHGEQEIQGSPPDADISVLQAGHNALLMPAKEQL